MPMPTKRVQEAPGSGALSRKVSPRASAASMRGSPSPVLQRSLHVNASLSLQPVPQGDGRTVSAYVRKAKTSEAKYFSEESSLRTLEISELMLFLCELLHKDLSWEETGMTPHRTRPLSGRASSRRRQ